MRVLHILRILHAYQFDPRRDRQEKRIVGGTLRRFQCFTHLLVRIRRVGVSVCMLVTSV